jgi:hypothetical protein
MKIRDDKMDKSKCIICGKEFVKIRKNQILCGAKKCRNARKQQNKKLRAQKLKQDKIKREQVSKNIAQEQAKPTLDHCVSRCAICNKPFHKKTSKQILCGNPDCIKARQEKVRLTRQKNKPTEKKNKPKPKHEQKIRICLKCDNEFMSEWIGNRICASCKTSKAFSAGLSEYNVNTRKN